MNSSNINYDNHKNLVIDQSIFYKNTVSLSLWNILNFPMTVLNFSGLLLLFLIRRELLVSICGLFFNNWYALRGTNSEGRMVYFSVGLFKICHDTTCIILGFFYLFLIIL
ncbi:hypothetical protein HZS_3194 [Henneguya salminicola]|nr:hypothetical protein HZS_3194 [Henneguya salminicola]